jgi:hypothetical protein
MGGVSRIVVAEKEILVIDYSGIKASEMITLPQQGGAQAVFLQKPVRVLTIMNEGNYVHTRICFTI